jgi:4'-phosphopantetheinyl transferase
MSAHGDDDDLDELARATLAPREVRAFAAVAAVQRPGVWLRAWVRKEAALKAGGHGLGDRALCELDVSDDHVDGLSLRDLDVGPGYTAAIATTTPVVEIRLEDWSDESR